jgi:hypothetical protein
LDILSGPDVARVSPLTGQNGEALYAPADRRKSVRERIEMVRWILAH